MTRRPLTAGERLLTVVVTFGAFALALDALVVVAVWALATQVTR